MLQGRVEETAPQGQNALCAVCGNDGGGGGASSKLRSCGGSH